MRILMLVFTDVAHDARVLKQMRALSADGHDIHVIGRAVPEGFEPPARVSVGSAAARSPFRRGGAPSTENTQGSQGALSAQNSQGSQGALGAGREPRQPNGAGTSAAVAGRVRTVSGAAGLARSVMAQAVRAGRWTLLPEHVAISVRTWAAEAYRKARDREFDVVHVHDFTALEVGERLAREHGVPFVYDAHEWWSGRARHGRADPLRRRREAILEARLARRAAAVITVSDGIAQRFRGWGVESVTVVRNTFPTSLGGPLGTRLDGLLYAGRIAEGRDLGTALRAAPSLAPRRLVLMGPADPGFLAGFPDLRGVEVRPVVAVDEVDEVLRECGAALVSLEDSCDNHRLALPNKIFQAVRAGVPVLAADLPEIRRLVRATGIGTLYIPGRPESLVAAVAELAAGYDGYVAAVDRAREQLRWEADEARLREVYAGLGAPGRCDRPDVSVLSPVHDVADARLHRIVGALSAAGLRVEVIGTGRAGDAPPGVDVRVLPRVGPGWRAARSLVLPAQARGRVLLTLAPDLAPAAALDRLVRARPWVADVYEDYLPLLADRSWARGAAGGAARAVARLGDLLTGSADLTTVADEHVPPHRARRRIVLRNLPSPAQLPEPTQREPAPRAVYIGDVRASRGLRTMLAAVEDAPGWTLDVIGPVAEGDREWLAGWRARSPAADRVRFHGRLDPVRSWALAAGAWAGLALLEDTPAFRRAMPSKVYEYAAAGLAVLASPLPRVTAALGASGAGRTAASASEAAAVLREWEADPDGHAATVRAARAWWVEQAAGLAAYTELAEAVTALVTGADSRASRAVRGGARGQSS